MGIGASIIVFTVGAILRFAVTATATGFNIQTIGLILMIVGAVGFVMSLIFWASWGGYGFGARRRTVVSRANQVPGAGVPVAGPAQNTVVTETEYHDVV